MTDNNHISDVDLFAFQHDRMNPKDKEKFLEHICSCDYCSEQFVALISTETLAAPRDMKENILRTSKRPEVQIALNVNKTSKRMQLLLYSLKVGTATIAALLLLLLTMNFNDVAITKKIPDNSSSSYVESSSLTATIRNNMNSISNRMLDFSNNIMKTEVINNDQKEK